MGSCKHQPHGVAQPQPTASVLQKGRCNIVNVDRDGSDVRRSLELDYSSQQPDKERSKAFRATNSDAEKII